MANLLITLYSSLAHTWYELLKITAPTKLASCWLDKDVTAGLSAIKGTTVDGFAGSASDFICYELSREVFVKFLSDVACNIYHVDGTVITDATADTFISSYPMIYVPDTLAGVTTALPDEGHWSQVEGTTIKKFVVRAQGAAAGYLTIRLPYDVSVTRIF